MGNAGREPAEPPREVPWFEQYPNMRWRKRDASDVDDWDITPDPPGIYSRCIVDYDPFASDDDLRHRFRSLSAA